MICHSFYPYPTEGSKHNMTDIESKNTKREHAVLRLSKLPEGLKESNLKLVKELDANGDGAIDMDEFVDAVHSLKKERSSNRNLSKVVSLLALATLLLIASIFGVSIAAAHYAKDTTIDDDGHFCDKNTGDVLQTSQASIWTDAGTNIMDLTTSQLIDANKIVLMDGNINFDIKGFSKSPSGDQLMLNVEGGTITYDMDGIMDATGDARKMLEFAIGANLTSMNDASYGSNLNPEGRKLFRNQMSMRFFWSRESVY